MKAVIFHNPRCGTSRTTLGILQESGLEVEVIEYLSAPPSREQLFRLFEAAGLTPRDGLRRKEALAAELGLSEADDETVLDAMIAHPILIERPLVQTPNGVRLCRPAERVREIL